MNCCTNWGHCNWWEADLLTIWLFKLSAVKELKLGIAVPQIQLLVREEVASNIR